MFLKFITIIKAKEIVKVTTLIYSSEIIDTLSDCSLMNEGCGYTLYHFIAFIYLLSKNNADEDEVRDKESVAMRNMMEYLVKKKEYKSLSSYFIKSIEVSKSKSNDLKMTTRYHTRRNSFEMRRKTHCSITNKPDNE